MNRFLSCIALFLAGCLSNPLTVPGPVLGFGVGKKLTIVVPPYWSGALAPYVHLKKDEGFQVEVISPKLDPDKLKSDIFATHPNYVFLVGDVGLIPTVYTCEKWDVLFEKSCTYSDMWLTTNSDGHPLFPIGRLMVNSEHDVTNYVVKAEIYAGRTGTAGAYIIGDRNYDSSDAVTLAWQKRLQDQGVPTRHDVIGIWADPYRNDG